MFLQLPADQIRVLTSSTNASVFQQFKVIKYDYLCSDETDSYWECCVFVAPH